MSRNAPETAPIRLTTTPRSETKRATRNDAPTNKLIRHTCPPCEEAPRWCAIRALMRDVNNNNNDNNNNDDAQSQAYLAHEWTLATRVDVDRRSYF